MNEETKDLLLKYLQAGAERIERGSAFVEAEIPLVVTEYLNWYWYSHVFWVVFLPTVWLLWLALLLWRVRLLPKPEDDELTLFMCVVLLIGFLVCTVGTASSAYRCIKVSVAPRVVLLEKIAEIAK
jgi:hypothetical protein